VLLAATLALSACGSSDQPPVPQTETPTPTATPTATPTPRPPREVRRSHCPPDVAGCKTVRGTIIYRELVDPDGDGDLHVIVDAGSLTLPGMTVIDVAKDLRPARDPRLGDRASAAGPLATGSYGQEQIEALEFRVQRP
jgi:hypothetical protein